jgi:hypothetical protein
MHNARRAVLLAPLLLCCTCSAGTAQEQAATSSTQARSTRWGPALVDAVPHVRQRPDFCGEACVAMALQGLGHEVDQDMVFALTGVDPSLGRGAWTAELRHALLSLGFDPGPVWERLGRAPTDADLDRAFTALHADLEAEIPSIVCMHYDESPNSGEHFRLILGYDPVSDELLYHEPAEDDGAWRRMDRRAFYRLWPLRGREDYTLIRLRLAPDTLRPPVRGGAHSAADYAQHTRRIRAIMPDGFVLFVEPPFVVVGNEAPAMVEARAHGTVRTYAKALEADFFDTPPSEIYTAWLFADERSYRHYARALFGDEPDTPYGYASAHHRALVMNIGLGGGTLVHEMVHPYVDSDCPDCPQWLNEGLASLFEHVGMQDGRITGFTNWRVVGLQRAIEHDAVPSFEWLMQQSFVQFYREDPGTNYAQSRYLCQYLQEKGLLRTYYRQVRANLGDDPTGYQSLERVLGIQDHEAFEAEWEAWVMGLEAP